MLANICLHYQTIFVTEGVGLCQREGGPVEIIRPGDCVFFEPGENHWHGAAPSRFMVHLAMQQNDESGSPVTWGRHVTHEEYGRIAEERRLTSAAVASMRSGGADASPNWGNMALEVAPRPRGSPLTGLAQASGFARLVVAAPQRCFAGAAPAVPTFGFR